MESSNNDELNENTLTNIASAVERTDELLTRDKKYLRDFSTFVSRPLAASSPLTNSYTDIQHLKALMLAEEQRPQDSCGKDLFLRPLPGYRHTGRPFLTSQLGNPYGMHMHMGHMGWPTPPPYPYMHDHCFMPHLYRSRSEPSAIGHEKLVSESSSDKEDVVGILKKPSKRSPPQPLSPDLSKDINLYQSGGIVILQSFKSLPEATERKAISEMTSKLIEETQKLGEDLKDGTKEGKMVQFDLSRPVTSTGITSNRTTLVDQPSSLSTNESITHQAVSVSSPASSMGAPPLEWDSLADVGYLSVDINKEKISTLERLTLQGLDIRGKAERKVVYKTNRGDKVVLERIPSDIIEMEERRPEVRDAATDPDAPEPVKSKKSNTSDSITQTMDQETLQTESVSGGSRSDERQGTDKGNRSPRRRRPSPSGLALKELSKQKVASFTSGRTDSSNSTDHKQHSKLERGRDLGPSKTSRRSRDEKKFDVTENEPLMVDQSMNVNTLGEEFGFQKIRSSESSDVKEEKVSPRTKKLKKKRMQEMSFRSRKIQEIIEIAKMAANGEQNERRVEEITVDHSFQEQTPVALHRPVSLSSIASASTVIQKLPTATREDREAQTSARDFLSKAVQVGDEPDRKVSKCVQASGEMNSLPKHLDAQRLSDSTEGAVRTKSTQFFGEGANSLPRALTNMERVKQDKETISKATKSQPQKSSGARPQKKECIIAEAGPSSRYQLTEKSLKGDVVDTRILQDKFFASQRDIVNKTRSTDTQTVQEPTAISSSPIHTVDKSQQMSANSSFVRTDESRPGKKQMVSVGIQYSLQNDSRPHKKSHEGRDGRDVEGDAWSDTQDSQGSSTQTAHSWVPAGHVRNAVHTVVRPTRSFEYLPGDVYESSGNLREKLPSETSQNVITESESSVESEPSLCNADTDGGGLEIASIGITGASFALDDSNQSTSGAWLVIPENSNRVKVVPKANHNNMAGRPQNDTLDRVSKSSTEKSEQNIEFRRNSKDSAKERRRSKDSVESRGNGGGSSSSSNNSEAKSEKGNVEKKVEMDVRRKGSSPDSSVASKHSAAVQTDTGLGLAGHGADILRLLSTIAQTLAAERCNRQRSVEASEVLSLDRRSRYSQRTSAPQSSRIVTERSIAATSEISRTVKQTAGARHVTRAASTPIPDHKIVAEKVVHDTVDLDNNDHSRTGPSLDSNVSASKNIFPCTQKEESERSEIEEQPLNLPGLTNSGDTRKTQLADQSTQVSGKSESGTWQACRKCLGDPCRCEAPRAHTDQYTQVSYRGCSCKKNGCLCHSSSERSANQCRDCERTPCVCSLNLPIKSTDRNVCDKCRRSECICPSSASRRDAKIGCPKCKKIQCECSGKRIRGPSYEKPSDTKFKKNSGQVFKTYVDQDFSSSEVSSLATSRSHGANKENAHCSVCKCPANDVQKCVFCCCHIDKKLHIPQCDCHKGSPRYVLAGFCKCHKRNLRSFEKCKCRENDVVKDGQCPCCTYFTSRMRANLIATQLEGTKHTERKVPPPPPKEYFLKLEETDISKDSTDVSEPERRPLDVVTIKIPVKRMGKAKVPCRQFYYDGDTGNANSAKEKEIEYLEDIVRKYQNGVSERSERSATSKTTREYSNTASKSVTSRRSCTSVRTLQEWLESNRPDFLSSAEYRRRVIAERARDRELRQMGQSEPPPPPRPAAPQPLIAPPARIFTTAEIREQTRRKCKKLSEVTTRKEDRRRVENYRTNRLNAEIFAKRLQIKTLRGQLDISNSCNLLAA